METQAQLQREKYRKATKVRKMDCQNTNIFLPRFGNSCKGGGATAKQYDTLHTTPAHAAKNWYHVIVVAIEKHKMKCCPDERKMYEIVYYLIDSFPKLCYTINNSAKSVMRVSSKWT